MTIEKLNELLHDLGANHAAMNRDESIYSRAKDALLYLQSRVDNLWASRNEAIEYQEAVDAMLDGVVPTKKDGKNVWLKERVQLVLDQLEQTADKLSDVWIHLDSFARGEAPDMEFVKGTSRKILENQQAPGWKSQFMPK